MLFYANPCGAEVLAHMEAGTLGFIDTPAQGNRRPEGIRWCADNGCYGKGYPGDDKWLRWLERNSHAASLCAFATAPDVVGDAAATLARSAPHLPRIRALGYPAAFVAQDGFSRIDVPWDAFDVLFIGGSDEFKLGAEGREAVREAKARGKHVHMGRVNSGKRFRYAYDIGCDSVDGTYLVHGPAENLPNLMGWVRQLGQVAFEGIA